jgi:hypothetical protein
MRNAEAEACERLHIGLLRTTYVHHCGEKVAGAVVLLAHAKLFPSPEKLKKYYKRSKSGLVTSSTSPFQAGNKKGYLCTVIHCNVGFEAPTDVVRRSSILWERTPFSSTAAGNLLQACFLLVYSSTLKMNVL